MVRTLSQYTSILNHDTIYDKSIGLCDYKTIYCYMYIVYTDIYILYVICHINMVSIPIFSLLSTYCAIIFFMGDNSSLCNLNIDSPSQAT